MKATIFGAGNIGRGLVGYVLERAGYDLHFVDVNEHLVAALVEAGSYRVTTDAGESHTVQVAGAVSARDDDAVVAAVAGSDVIATAVGAAILPIVAEPIANGLLASTVSDVNVIACENMHPNSEVLGERVADKGGAEAGDRAGFPDVVVDRIIPGDPPAGEDIDLDLEVETHFEFLVESGPWRGPRPNTADLTFVDDLDPFRKRKLWLVNGLHAAAAWLGLQSGHEYIDQAVADPAISSKLEEMASTMVAVLAAQHPFMDEDDLANYARVSLSRFGNGAMPDPCARVARNPLVKLGPDEHILASALAADDLGLDVLGHAAAICAALRLDGDTTEGAADLASAVAAHGWSSLLAGFGVTADSKLMNTIRECIEMEETQTAAISVEVAIKNPSGLHARPAAMVVEKAKTLDADISIQKGEKKANAKSIMSVLTLGASHGDVIHITADGPDAQTAVDFITDLMNQTEEES